LGEQAIRRKLAISVMTTGTATFFQTSSRIVG
jgi:hypothetical protein